MSLQEECYKSNEGRKHTVTSTRFYAKCHQRSNEEVDEAMQTLGLWDTLRNYKVALVGMHYGEELIEWID